MFKIDKATYFRNVKRYDVIKFWSVVDKEFRSVVDIGQYLTYKT